MDWYDCDAIGITFYERHRSETTNYTRVVPEVLYLINKTKNWGKLYLFLNHRLPQYTFPSDVE